MTMSKNAMMGLKRDLRDAEEEYSRLSSKDSSVVSVPETEWKNISI